MNELKQRPRGLSLTAAAMLVFLSQSVVSASSMPSYDWFLFYIIFLFVFLIAGVVGIWCYWRGQNWARRLALAYSAFTIWWSVTWGYSYFTRWESPRWNYWLLSNTLEVIFGAFLLYWLNTPRIRTFFEKAEPVARHNRFLNALEEIGIWGAALLLFWVGIFLGAAFIIVRRGLSNVGLLLLYMAGPPIVAYLIVGIYYRLRRAGKTQRRLVFFVAAWTFLFGLLLINSPSPIRQWFQYLGGAMTADRRLEFYEGMEESSAPSLQSKNRHLVEVSYSTAEKWHLWGITLAEGLGPASPLLAKTLEDAGDFYRDRSQDAKALPLYWRSMAVWEKAFGSNNHFVTQVRGKLNETIRSQEAVRAAGQR